MKNIVLLIVFIFLFVISCDIKSIEPQKSVSGIVEEYKKHNSISYNIDYGIKHFGDDKDTTKITAVIDLIKAPLDSIFGGLIWINYDSTDIYYDTQNIYVLYHREKMILRYKKEQSFGITGKTAGATSEVYFLKPDRLINLINDTTNTTTVIDNKLNNTKLLEIDFQKDEYIENAKERIWINNKNNLISKIDFSADMQGENQYNYWNLTDMIFDKVTVDDLEKRFLQYKNIYVTKDFKMPDKKDFEPLAANMDFPDFEGSEYKTGKKIAFHDFKGKIVLLDFWYMDCFPCLKAIPHINKLFSQYSDKELVVLGINPINNNKKDLNRFPDFLKKNIIDYPIVFIEKEKTSELKVKGYPTLYLIDKSGKIIYSTIGFEKETMNKIDSLIKESLK